MAVYRTIVLLTTDSAAKVITGISGGQVKRGWEEVKSVRWHSRLALEYAECLQCCFASD